MVHIEDVHLAYFKFDGPKIEGVQYCQDALVAAQKEQEEADFPLTFAQEKVECTTEYLLRVEKDANKKVESEDKSDRTEQAQPEKS